ncbi:histidine kinase [Persicitalea sp.]|uniref:sensor histidine kinase n=1 Tax=Persicitalea sp. TaxID=3100273 RepID=UPI003593E0B8
MHSYEALRFFLDGMLYMMALFALLSYFQQRKPIYWQYTVYIVCITITFYLDDADATTEYMPGTNYWITCLESLAFVMYISFAVQLIGIREKDSRSYRILRGMVILLAVETVFEGLLFLLDAGDQLKSLSYAVFRFAIAGVALVVVPRILRLRQPVVSYFITGSLIFVAGCLFALIVNYFPDVFNRNPDNPFTFSVTYMQLGVVGEVLCFTLGMALRNQENELEKIRVQEQLIGQLRENELKNQKLLKIRDDIARDLHDELGADLASISMVSHAVAHQMLTDPTLARESLKQIGETARKVIKLMREIVWSLHSAHDSSQQFADRMREMGLGLYQHHPTKLHFDFKTNGQPVPSHLRRDLYLIYKEIIHNALRHSQAENVYVQFRTSSERISLYVKDDGQGFDATLKHPGNGLISLKKRAESLNGQLQIESTPHSGTKTSLICPLEV